VTSDDRFQDDLPAYIAGRLEGDDLRRLEEHLRVCDDCGDLATTWRGIVKSLREGGEALFESHPGEMELREFSLGAAAPTHHGIQRHLESCASCTLEVEAWRRRGTPATMREVAPAKGRRGFWTPVLAAAGGMILGAGLVLLSGPGRPNAQSPALGEEVGLLILPASPLRGSGPPRPYTLRSGQQRIEVGFRPTLPSGIDGAGRYRFEIRRDSGATIWSVEKSVADLRRIMAMDEIVGFSFPTSSIGPGRYEFRTIPPGATGEKDEQRVVVEILPPQ